MSEEKKTKEKNVFETGKEVSKMYQEKVKTIKSSYVWGTDYGRNRFEETRTIVLPEETSADMEYTYRMVSQADLCQMVIFNAYTQGYMTEEEYEDIMIATSKTLGKALPYLRLDRIKAEEVYTDVMSIFKRVRQEYLDFKKEK